MKVMVAAVCLVLSAGNVVAQEAFPLPDPPVSRISELGPIDLKPPRSFLLLKDDANAIIAAPLHWNSETWKNVGLTAGAIGVVMLLDDDIRSQILKTSEGPAGEFADVVEPFGSDYSWAVLAGFYGAGKLFNDSRASAVAEDGLTSSLIAAGLITPALKSLAGRTRPSQSIHDYQFGHNGASFPSGHTTQAFAIASVIASHYDSFWVDSLAYGIAAGVGYARVAHGAHFSSDVLTGAIIGIAVGKAVVRLHDERRQLRLEPFATTDGAVGLSIRFGLPQFRRSQP